MEILRDAVKLGNAVIESDVNRINGNFIRDEHCKIMIIIHCVQKKNIHFCFLACITLRKSNRPN